METCEIQKSRSRDISRLYSIDLFLLVQENETLNFNMRRINKNLSKRDVLREKSDVNTYVCIIQKKTYQKETSYVNFNMRRGVLRERAFEFRYEIHTCVSYE